MKKSALEKVLAMPDNSISDDDHPDKPDISKSEFVAALKEMGKKFKDKEPKNPKNDDLARATVRAMNEE